MNKHARLLALLLAFAAPLSYSTSASAMTSMCARAVNALETTEASTSVFYNFWVYYYGTYC